LWQKEQMQSGYSASFIRFAINWEGREGRGGRRTAEGYFHRHDQRRKTEALRCIRKYVAFVPTVRSHLIEYWKLEEAKIRRQPPEKGN